MHYGKDDRLCTSGSDVSDTNTHGKTVRDLRFCYKIHEFPKVSVLNETDPLRKAEGPLSGFLLHYHTESSQMSSSGSSSVHIHKPLPHDSVNTAKRREGHRQLYIDHIQIVAFLVLLPTQKCHYPN